MKRDMDLIRRILLALEDHEGTDFPQLHFEGVADEQLQYHLVLMGEAGLIDGIPMSHVMEFQFDPYRLTWYGHEFLDDIRNEAVWERVKRAVMTHLGGSVSVVVLQELARNFGRTLLQLPTE
jgi:hypothetical protein